MNDPTTTRRRAIPLLVIRRRKRSAVMSESLKSDPSVARQLKMIRSFAAKRDMELADLSLVPILPWSKPNSLLKKEIADAVRKAQSHDADLIVADACVLLEVCDRDDFGSFYQRLADLHISIHSVADDCCLHSVAPDVVKARFVSVWSRRVDHASRVRGGLRKSAKAGVPSETALREAATANGSLADSRAVRIAKEFDRVLPTLPEDERRNLSAIARRLAKEGVRGPRGGELSGRALKRALERVQRIPRGAAG